MCPIGIEPIWICNAGNEHYPGHPNCREGGNTIIGYRTIWEPCPTFSLPNGTGVDADGYGVLNPDGTIYTGPSTGNDVVLPLLLPTKPLTVITTEQLILNLAPEIAYWWNHTATSALKDQITAYIVAENHSQEALAFINELVFLAFNDNEIDNNTINFVLQAKAQNKFYMDLDDAFIQSMDQYLDMDISSIDPVLMAQISIHFTTQCAVLRFNHDDWSENRIYWEASKDLVHIALDAFGLIPVVGEVADLINGTLYVIEGDGINASLSYASAVPILGWATAGTKLAIRINNVSSTAYTVATKVKLTWNVVGNVVKFGNRSQLKKVLGMGANAIDARQAHHLIPWAKSSHPAIQKAARSENAFHMNEALNGIPLNTAVHNGSHANYDNLVQMRLNNININQTEDQVYNEVLDIINDIRTAIQNNPTTPINQLSF